jgi:hypothetical protein
MPQKKHWPEEIVAKLRQVDVLLSQVEKENDRLRKAVSDMAKFSISERYACKVLGQHRSTQRNAERSSRRRGIDHRHHPARVPLWPLRLSQDHGDAAI